MNFHRTEWKKIVVFAIPTMSVFFLVSQHKYISDNILPLDTRASVVSGDLPDHQIKHHTSLSTENGVTQSYYHINTSQDWSVVTDGSAISSPRNNKKIITHDGSIVHVTYHEHRSRNDIVILYWLTERQRTLQSSGLKRNCRISGEKTCSFTQDKTMYNYSEAIIFDLFYARQFPSHRYSDQKWVVLGREAPPQCTEVWPKSNILDRIKNQFNISSMYTSDSAVSRSLPDKCTLNMEAYNKTAVSGMNIAENRTHNVVWIASHCKTQSQREDYVEELRKHIDVDVYGMCGNLSCGSKKNRMPHCADEILNKKYRFYLSFENSLCQDYVTEKLKKILEPEIKIIPVVMGAVNYSTILPPKTYIDVKDFQSPRHLAKYLHTVANNQTLFNEYIGRKSALTCENYGESYLCRLCKYLHAHRGEVEMIPDVTSYWSIQHRCTKPQIYLPGNFWT